MHVHLRTIATRHSEARGRAKRWAFYLLTTTALSAFGFPALAVAQGAASDQAPVADNEPRKLDAVIVTAQKRAQNLQDVPLSIQAIGEAKIENLGIQQFEDLALIAPSVSFVSAGPGTQNLFVRGISDGGNPNRTTTATATLYLDEQPLTVGGTIIDLHGYDIERYEILNGPQGTYYGSGSVSGTVRIITNKPDPTEFEAGFDLTAAAIQKGGAITTAEGFLNLPVANEKAAVRLVGWYDKDGGFIDNIPLTRTWANGAVSDNSNVAEKNYNNSTTIGGRAALRAELTPDWTGTVSGFYQKAETNGAWDHDPRRRGDLQVARFTPDRSEREFSQIGLTLEGATPIADIVLSTSYFSQDETRSSDYSDYVEYASFNQWIQQFACDDFYYYGNIGCNDPRMSFNADYFNDRWSTELRATSNGDGPLQWIAGAYYEKNRSEGFGFWDMPGIKFEGAPGAYYLAVNGGDPLPNEWYSYGTTGGRGTDEQTALFGELSYNLTEALKLTIGARVFDDSFSSPAGGWSGYFYDPKTGGEASSGGTSGEAYKLNIQYRLSENLLTYFNYAEGFRPGGSNGSIGQTNQFIPETYSPDYLDSYEIGWKSQFNNGRLTFNGAIYKMLWQDFQTSIYDINIAPVIFYANAGNAEVTGAEIELNTFLNDNWTVDFSANYTDSVLSEDFKSLVDPNLNFAGKGTRLPYVPEWKFSVSSRYEWQQSASTDGYIQASYSYTGETYNLLLSDPFRTDVGPQIQKAYSELDLRIGWKRGPYRLEAYGTNLFDERAQLFINTGYYDERITTNRPRTLGVRLIARY